MVKQGKPHFLQFNIREYPHKDEHKYIVTSRILLARIKSIRIKTSCGIKTQDLQEKNQQLNEEIVRREQAQKHLIQTQEELVQAAKMAVVGQNDQSCT